MTTADPHRLIAGLVRERVAIELKTVEICFLAGLQLRAQSQALASFEEDALVDLFEQVCDMVEPGAENPRKRATHAIQRLREQRMLARVDGAGIVRAGEYTLTRLAAGVVAFFLAEEALTRESLTLLTATLRAQLGAVLAAARQAVGDEAWRTQVVGPLQVTVADLVGGIERRQRGLDAQQEEVQAEIGRLLAAEWSSAIDRCQELLDATAGTLRELNEVLLRDAHQLLALLQEIQALAHRATQASAEAAAQLVSDHVDRIAAWGGARQRAWSSYYQHVHRYLRDVVRLDPDRALSQRLRDQLGRWPSSPFHLLVAQAPGIRQLRPSTAALHRPAIARPRAEREADPDWVEGEDREAVLAALVAEAWAAGARTLSAVAQRVLPALPASERYGAVGRIAAALTRLAVVRSARVRPWMPLADGLEIEEWEAAPAPPLPA